MMVLGYLFFGKRFCHVVQMGLEPEAILLPRVHVCIALSSSSILLLVLLCEHECLWRPEVDMIGVFFYCSSYWDWFSLNPEITNWLEWLRSSRDPPNSVLLAQCSPGGAGVFLPACGAGTLSTNHLPGPFSKFLISFIISIEENFHFLQFFCSHEIAFLMSFLAILLLVHEKLFCSLYHILLNLLGSETGSCYVVQVGLELFL